MIRIEHGDIATFQGDAIVNAANNHLQLGAGVAGAIRKRGGETIQQECNEYIRVHGSVSIGDAVATRAGDLPARWVIHAAAMGDQPASSTSIESATRRALEVARELGARTIAFPILGSGVGGFSFRTSAETMISVIRAHRAAYGEPEEVVLYGYTAADVKELRSLLLT